MVLNFVYNTVNATYFNHLRYEEIFASIAKKEEK